MGYYWVRTTVAGNVLLKAERDADYKAPEFCGGVKIEKRREKPKRNRQRVIGVM